MRKLIVSDIRDPYLAHLRARGLAAGTVKMHSVFLNRWVSIVGDTRVDLIKPHHVETFFAGGGWSGTTQNLYLSVLRCWIAWLHRHGHLPRHMDPTEGWRNVRTETKEQFWLPVDEFSALLDAADNPRDRAVIAIGLYTFLRGSEVASLRLQDVDFDRNTISVYRWKTKEADVMPMCVELREELERWIKEYKRLMVFNLVPEWYLVPTRKPVTDPHTAKYTRTIEAELLPTVKLFKPYECVKRALQALGYDPKGTGAHSLRRSGARALFDRLRSEGYDGALRRVSAMLGHKDTKTTEIYLGLSLERQQRNELLAGQVMFPAQRRTAKVVPLKEVQGGNRG